MDKYLAPEPIGEGDLHPQWKRFSREFGHFWLRWVKVLSLTKRNWLIFCAWLGREEMTCMKHCGSMECGIR